MDNHKTPQWIMNIFSNWFDPCPLNDNPTFDGLSIEWEHKSYVNPPYSNILGWVEKAIEENKKGKQIALLLPLDCSTKWYRRLIEVNAIIFYLSGRVLFEGKHVARSHIIVILK
jgi:hypothetical protein|tara:strand:- start:210 stop:551 length:342 start_codon:yes stop_codon:yes gene_type:complete